jgi:hypothetical protein
MFEARIVAEEELSNGDGTTAHGTQTESLYRNVAIDEGIRPEDLSIRATDFG